MSYNLETKGYLPWPKMDRKDIVLAVLSTVVCILSIGVIYAIARNPGSDFDDIDGKMRRHQAEIDTIKANIARVYKGKQQPQYKTDSNDTGTSSFSTGELKSKLEEQQDQLVKQQETLTEIQQQRSSNGVVYIRWGRKDCLGNTTELVYSGYAGGSHYSNVGAAAEYVCLPPDPSWGPKQNIRVQQPGFMYGAEYEDDILFNVKDRNRDVPCAVCRSSFQSTSIMIPARVQCYPGWTEAYRGYLASGYYKQPAASQYVCVDQEPQTLLGGGSSNDEGKLFFQVRAKCGSLKCPPYEDDKVLSCVVCLK